MLTTFLFTVSSDHTDHFEHQQPAPGGFSSMSLARKMLFILSILNCLAFTLIFLFVLPCEYDTCQSPFAPIDLEWEIQLDGKSWLYFDILIPI